MTIRAIHAAGMAQIINEMLRYILVTRTNRTYDPGAILINRSNNIKIESDPVCIEKFMDDGYVVMRDLDEFASQLEMELINTINMRIGKMLGEFDYERAYHIQMGGEPL